MLIIKKLIYRIVTNLRIISIQYEQTKTLANGYFTLTVPSGFNTNDIAILIPMYLSGGAVGWSASLQASTSTNFNVYVRTGTTVPTGSVKYNAVFIKR